MFNLNQWSKLVKYQDVFNNASKSISVFTYKMKNFEESPAIRVYERGNETYINVTSFNEDGKIAVNHYNCSFIKKVIIGIKAKFVYYRYIAPLVVADSIICKFGQKIAK